MRCTPAALPLRRFSIFNFQFSICLRRRPRVPSTEAYLLLSGALFAVGLLGVVIRRNMITVLMSIELMLNAVNINFIAFSHRLASLEGQIFSIFVITVAAGEAAVGLAIIIQLYRLKSTVNVDEAKELNCLSHTH